MITLKDRILIAKDSDIIKSYNINGTKISFTSKQFKYILNKSMDISSINSYAESVDAPTIVGALKKINDNTIGVSFKYFCTDCKGTGEIDCEDCDGTGEIECSECGNTHECTSCDGAGVFECNKCKNNPYDEDDILLNDTIDLNQGEIFQYERS